MTLERKSITAYIPVRAGSKGIPGKNIKLMVGKPLLHWTASACLDCKNIDKVVIATDSDEIAETALLLNNPKMEIFWRGTETCTDTASTESAMLEYANQKDDFTHIMLVQATSPMLKSEHIEDAVHKYFESGADSLIALVRQLKFIWKENADGTVTPVNYNPMQRPRRQEFNGILTEPGAFYITSRAKLLETSCRISGKTIAYELPEELYFDLDTLLDWEVVEAVMRKNNNFTEQHNE